MLFYLIGIVIIIYSFINFKNSFMLFLAYKLILVQNITVISIPGIPLLTLDMFMSIFYVMFYFLKKNYLKMAKTSFPFMTPCIALCGCWFMSSMFSVAGVLSELSALIGNIINEFLLLVVIWEVIENEKDFKFLFKIMTIVILTSCIYGFIEYSIKVNPLTVYESTLNHDIDKTINYIYNAEGLRGYRVQSIFEHTIGAGMIWALYAAFVFMISVNYSKTVGGLPIITAILCIPMVMLSKQRAGIFMFVVLILTFLKPQKKRLYLLLVPLVVGFWIFSDEILNNIQLLLSIFDNSFQNAVGGSNAEMRFDQLSAAFNLMYRSPIFGLGSKFRQVINNSDVSHLIGSESVWFTVIPGYGLLGIFAYIQYIIYGVFRIPLHFKSINLFWIMLSYWLVYSLTSIPGFKTYLLFLVVMYVIKNSDSYKNIDQRINEWKFGRGTIIYHKYY